MVSHSRCSRNLAPPQRNHTIFDPLIPPLRTAVLESDSTQLLLMGYKGYLLEERCPQYLWPVHKLWTTVATPRGHNTEDTSTGLRGSKRISNTQRGLIQKFPVPYSFISIYQILNGFQCSRKQSLCQANNKIRWPASLDLCHACSHSGLPAG